MNASDNMRPSRRIFPRSAVSYMFLAALGLSTAGASAQFIHANIETNTRPSLAPFSPPSGPLLLTRTISRSLSDGEDITITRQWEIYFTKTNSGYSITGKQQFIDVQAPAELMILSQIESQRVENGPFPLLLNNDGIITSQAFAPSRMAVDQAVEEGLTMLSFDVGKTATLSPTKEFLTNIHNSANDYYSGLPADLFHPEAIHTQIVRPLVLPDGEAGKFTTSCQAVLAPSGAYMQASECSITTELGNSTQTSFERWTLEPITR